MKRLKWFCPLINSTNTSHSKACVNNFAKMYSTCWSLPWSHFHTWIYFRYLASLAYPKLLSLLCSTRTLTMFISVLNVSDEHEKQRCWLGSGSVSHGAINLVARATVTTQMSGRREVTWSAQCKGLKTRVVLDLTFYVRSKRLTFVKLHL